MENHPITLLQAWTPTLIAAFLIVIAALLLGISISRDERRKEKEKR